MFVIQAYYITSTGSYLEPMGSGTSGLASETPGGDLRLPASGLRFSVNQLRALNSYVDSLWEDDQNGRISTETESAVESLVQRIVDGAGQRDPRFRCSHLIALHRGKKLRSRSLEYLVTLDSLPALNSSEKCRLLDGPVGYGRVRLTGRDAEKWEEFLTPSGFLCRDKVLERWVGLIARCANARGGGASRVLCARASQHALPYQYCYLERVSPAQQNTDRRLAIVEGAAWVMVRVGAGEAEAKLMLGARVEGCSGAAYTSRVPLTHPLALMHYTSAQGGYYATAVGPPTSVACPDRSSTWQLWHPGLEASLDAHCSDLSTVARVAGAINALIDKMREGSYQGTLRVLSRYLASCAVRRRLDRCAVYGNSAARSCVSSHASHHLLLVLDSLLSLCERGGVAGYIYPVERGALIRRGSRDADWESDAICVKSCLQMMHRVAGEDILPTPSECLETALFGKWEGLNRELKASVGSTTTYSRRQLRYMWRVSSELVRCKNLIICESHSAFKANLIQVTSSHNEPVENLIHVLAIMLDQARDLYLNNFHVRNCAEFDRELSVYRSKKWNKLKDYYDASSACLIDAVRRDPDLRNQDLKDHHIFMKSILNWLHKGAKDDRKYLGPVLKPYLDGLFTSSLENSWFLEEFDETANGREFDGLKEYCVGVHDGNLEPCLGLLDAAKRFGWAKAMVDFVDRFRHVEFRLVFPTGDGLAISYPLRLPSRREHSTARTLTLSRRHKAEAKLRLARRCVLAAFHCALTPSVQRQSKTIKRHESSDEILASVKTGNYWRNSTKPDIIPSTSTQDITKEDLPRVRRRSRRSRPATSYGFPEISITSQGDAKTLRRKYHTLKSLVYTEPVQSIKEMRERPRSAGSTVRNKEPLSRPSILETLDFINSVKDALCVEESGTSDTEESPWSAVDEWLIGHTAPLSLLASRSAADSLHLALADVVPALLHRGKFTILQELCSYLGEASEGALFALHRLARAARSRSSERGSSAWKLPEPEAVPETPQKYKARPPDYVSGDEAPPPPPPLPRRSSRGRQVPHYANYQPPNRLQILDNDSNINSTQPVTYTGIINPIYDIASKIPKDKFTVKRSKSLGRSFSTKSLGLDSKYITLGYRNSKKTNDVVTAIEGTTGQTGLDSKSSFFQKYSTADVVGDSYRLSRITID
ncbi:uncharacterized protein LOC115447051 isoform X2 [Manduca sexta]|uniref:Uncharacterized protein n=1 Tax=Manduca sexta TaxID=7130 RepID=A0A921ZF19_MANSE|nr:uncharacterized protein LOC115447051 isoform X2 [Manduca sexta]KAG6455656.1 hypothetical protein O3G_MSEX009329 [Manduca sexta]KAG6455657.1 hypothetical protein O3G_MSEX009329 [Manduca sexta]